MTGSIQKQKVCSSVVLKS